MWSLENTTVEHSWSEVGEWGRQKGQEEVSKGTVSMSVDFPH